MSIASCTVVCPARIRLEDIAKVWGADGRAYNADGPAREVVPARIRTRLRSSSGRPGPLSGGIDPSHRRIYVLRVASYAVKPSAGRGERSAPRRNPLRGSGIRVQGRSEAM